MSDEQTQPTEHAAPPSNAPYIFKRYLSGGGVVYEVRSGGRVLSIHADLASAEEAVSDSKQKQPAGEPDLADKIALFLEVANSRYHELRDDPTIAGIIERSNETYDQLKRANSFTDANRIATAKAIREIINGKR